MRLFHWLPAWINRRKRTAAVRKIAAQYAEKLNQKLFHRRREWDQEDAELRSLSGMASGAGDWGQMMERLGVRSSPLPTAREVSGQNISARFDSALTTEDNREHWAMASGLAADAEANPMIRYTLRNRARYEDANNCYCKGVGETIANDFCGTGPRLHIDDDRLTDEERDDVEKKFAAWTVSINLPGKLKTMRKAKRISGEAFSCKVTNPGLKHPVKLDLKADVEADQVRFVDISLLLSPSVDGIRFDDYGNPVSYHILRIHPGYWSYATGYVGMPWEYDVWDASLVYHWFRQDRPGQHRGLPETLPALPLYATLRRYTQATLDAAETGADFAVLLKTAGGAAQDFKDGEGDELQHYQLMAPYDSIAMDRRMITTLPAGYDAVQMQPQHPQQQYAAFKKEIVAEIGRCEGVTANVVLGDSSNSNMASGTLDHKLYYGARKIERDEIERLMLNDLLQSFIEFGVRLREGEGDYGQPYLPQILRTIAGSLEFTWFWDSNELGDILKVAAANSTALKDGATTLSEIYARRGMSYERAKKHAARDYGCTIEQFEILVRNSIFASRGTDPIDAPADEADAPPKPGEPAEPVDPQAPPRKLNKSGVKRPGQAAMRRATAEAHRGMAKVMINNQAALDRLRQSHMAEISKTKQAVTVSTTPA
jgi:hypothetical protein